jgi:EmrB/QacA subfamily drug resistance transporter
MTQVAQLQRSPGRGRQNPSILLAVILTAQMMIVLDATIVNVALPHIQRSLHFSSSSLSWVLNAYVLTFGGLLLLGARSGDLLGRRRTFLGGIGLFSLSSLAGGFATTSWMLLTARALQGVGGALAAPAALALLTTIFPEGPARVRAVGLFTTVSAAGGATGLVAGGLLTEWASWRWVMFVNVPIGLAVVVTGMLLLGESERRHGHFDLPGALTSTIGMTAVVLGLVEAGSSGWSSPLTLLSLTGGVVLLSVFVRIEATASEPILPLRILADRTRASANLARGLGYAGMYGMVFFLTQYLQDIQGHSPLVTGIGFLPAPTSVLLASQLTSKVLVNRLPAKVLMASGAALLAAGLVVATQLQVDTTYPQVLVSLILIGTGMGISFVSLTTAALHGVDPADAGAASGLINVMQQLGAALGLAVLVTVFDTVVPPSSSLTAGSFDAATTVHGIDVAFAAAALFSLAALAIIIFMVNSPAAHAEPVVVHRELEAEAA